jgi:hypothetical protein
MIILWHCIRLSVCVLSKLKCFRYCWTWFVITIFELRCNFWMLRTGCAYGWRPLNLLRSWLYMRNVVWNLSRFHGLPRLYGLKLDGLTMQWSLLRLFSYNLDGSVTNLFWSCLLSDLLCRSWCFPTTCLVWIHVRHDTTTLYSIKINSYTNDFRRVFVLKRLIVQKPDVKSRTFYACVEAQGLWRWGWPPLCEWLSEVVMTTQLVGN